MQSVPPMLGNFIESGRGLVQRIEKGLSLVESTITVEMTAWTIAIARSSLFSIDSGAENLRLDPPRDDHSAQPGKIYYEILVGYRNGAYALIPISRQPFWHMSINGSFIRIQKTEASLMPLKREGLTEGNAKFTLAAWEQEQINGGAKVVRSPRFTPFHHSRWKVASATL